MWDLDYKESWVPKNWCFWTVVLEKTLASPLDSNQSILKEISPGCSLEGLMLKLKFQYLELATRFKELTHWKRPWCWKRLRSGGEGATENGMIGWQLNEHEFEQTLGDSKRQGSLMCCCAAVHGIANSGTYWVTEQQYLNTLKRIQPSHLLSSPFPPAFRLSQHQGLFQWVSCQGYDFSSGHMDVRVGL